MNEGTYKYESSVTLWSEIAILTFFGTCFPPPKVVCIEIIFEKVAIQYFNCAREFSVGKVWLTLRLELYQVHDCCMLLIASPIKLVQCFGAAVGKASFQTLWLGGFMLPPTPPSSAECKVSMILYATYLRFIKASFDNWRSLRRHIHV